MIDALYSGISGLNSNQSALNTQSNNISNVNTVAYKSDKISFSDLMYQKSIGKGTMISDVSKNFTQGNLKSTGNNYDLAIDGPGFFILKGDSQLNLYTRAGNFLKANDGTLQTPNGFNVQGLVSTAPIVNGTNPNDNIFDNSYTNFIASQVIVSPNKEKVETINIKASDFISSASDDDIVNSGNNYKTKEAKITDINALIYAYSNELKNYSTSQIEGVSATNQVSDIQFDINSIDELSTLQVNIGINQYKVQFDTDVQTTLNSLSNKISNEKALSASVDANGLLKITSLIPGENLTISNANISNYTGIISNSTIDTTDAIEGSGKLKLEAIEEQLKTLIENAGGKFLKISNIVDSSDIENKQLDNIQLNPNLLNLSSDSFGDFELNDGIVYVKQGDLRFAVGKIMTSLFINEQGLIPKGGNTYIESKDSGEPIYANNANKIINKSLELSNTSIAEGLVDLMVFQRAFEANSKSITTSDEFLKTAIQLKK